MMLEMLNVYQEFAGKLLSKIKIGFYKFLNRYVYKVVNHVIILMDPIVVSLSYTF
jgi:hypothetical protein